MDIKDENFGFQEGSERCLIISQNGKNNTKEPPPETEAPKKKGKKGFERARGRWREFYTLMWKLVKRVSILINLKQACLIWVTRFR